MKEHFQCGVRWSESISNQQFIHSIIALAISIPLSLHLHSYDVNYFVELKRTAKLQTEIEFAFRKSIQCTKFWCRRISNLEPWITHHTDSNEPNLAGKWKEGSFLAHTFCCVVSYWMLNACLRLDYIHGSRVSNLPSSRCYYFTYNFTLLSCLIASQIIRTHTHSIFVWVGAMCLCI